MKLDAVFHKVVRDKPDVLAFVVGGGISTTIFKSIVIASTSSLTPLLLRPRVTLRRLSAALARW
jgi:hypothetical protein